MRHGAEAAFRDFLSSSDMDADTLRSVHDSVGHPAVRAALLDRINDLDLPCKNEGSADVNGEDGSCLRCGAIQGEACL